MLTTYNEFDHVREHLDLDMDDARGRKIGLQVVRCRMVYTALPDDADWGCLHAPGECLAVRMHVTRNGVPFGPVQGQSKAATAAEIDAIVARRVKTVRARYAAIATKGLCPVCKTTHGKTATYPGDNPCCPNCRHYNALLSGTCRDCGATA